MEPNIEQCKQQFDWLLVLTVKRNIFKLSCMIAQSWSGEKLTVDLLREELRNYTTTSATELYPLAEEYSIMLSDGPRKQYREGLHHAIRGYVAPRFIDYYNYLIGNTEYMNKIFSRLSYKEF